MPRTRETLDLLRRYESRNVTFQAPDGRWPIVWERARGVHVWDAAGKKYLDLTAAFGVAAAGHANPHVVKAGREQMGRLLHAMGDVHPHALKALLAQKLSAITFERWLGVKRGRAKSVFCNSGFEAVEAALKTAMVATGKPGIIAFSGGYHGLGYGALNATHREFFRSPFRNQLRRFGAFAPYPRRVEDLAEVESVIWRIITRRKVGAVLVEPMQARGGINVPPTQLLQLLRRFCDEQGALLILDDIYTGFGRTGTWFGGEHSGVVPDLVCLGKALTGGFPLSVCVGRENVMDAWPVSEGEALHTSTFLGHPVGCAMAMAQIGEVERLGLVERSREEGAVFLDYLRKVMRGSSLVAEVRGCGLFAGVELRRADGRPATKECIGAIEEMLRRGFILLPEGEHSNVISFTPPLTISRKDLRRTAEALAEVLERRYPFGVPPSGGGTVVKSVAGKPASAPAVARVRPAKAGTPCL